MKYNTIILTTLALTVAAFTAYAQDGTALRHQAGGPGAGPMPQNQRLPQPLHTILFDADQDGVLSAAEIAAAPAVLAKLDTNHDGQVTAAEVCPAGRRGPGGPPHAGEASALPPCLRVLDTDADGVLSAQEIANAAAALLTLDTNKDGQLTLDELRPAGRNGRGRGGLGGPGFGLGRGPRHERFAPAHEAPADGGNR